MTALELLQDPRAQASLARLADRRREDRIAQEIPGMVEVSAESQAGLTLWCLTYDFGVKVIIRAVDFDHAMRLAGGTVLMVEDLDSAEVA